MHTSVTVRFTCSLVHFAILLGLLVCFSHAAMAQVSTATNDGGTPPGIAPGAPAGAYPLSGLEQLSHYNGRLSLNVPLLQVGGRGSTGYSIPLNISPRPWIINSYAVPSQPPYRQVYWYHSPSEYWSGLEPGYSPGVMQLRRSGDGAHKEADESAISYPVNATLLQDTGFQGYAPDSVIVLQPKKSARTRTERGGSNAQSSDLKRAREG